MAKFVTTSATIYVLEQLIEQAIHRIVLISSYLKFIQRLKQLVQDRSDQGITFDIVYGKSELNEGEKGICSVLNINLYYCENLHAKCHLNEACCIISSMNLHAFSQVVNGEIGSLLKLKRKGAGKNIKYRLKNGQTSARKDHYLRAGKAQQDSYAENSDPFKAANLICDAGSLDKLTDKVIAFGADFKKSIAGGYFIWLRI